MTTRNFLDGPPDDLPTSFGSGGYADYGINACFRIAKTNPLLGQAIEVGWQAGQAPTFQLNDWARLRYSILGLVDKNMDISAARYNNVYNRYDPANTQFTAPPHITRTEMNTYEDALNVCVALVNEIARVQGVSPNLLGSAVQTFIERAAIRDDSLGGLTLKHNLNNLRQYLPWRSLSYPRKNTSITPKFVKRNFY